MGAFLISSSNKPNHLTIRTSSTGLSAVTSFPCAKRLGGARLSSGWGAASAPLKINPRARPLPDGRSSETMRRNNVNKQHEKTTRRPLPDGRGSETTRKNNAKKQRSVTTLGNHTKKRSLTVAARKRCLRGRPLLASGYAARFRSTDDSPRNYSPRSWRWSARNSGTERT